MIKGPKDTAKVDRTINPRATRRKRLKLLHLTEPSKEKSRVRRILSFFRLHVVLFHEKVDFMQKLYCIFIHIQQLMRLPKGYGFCLTYVK